MAGWMPCADWMTFGISTEVRDLDGAYTIGYRITDDGQTHGPRDSTGSRLRMRKPLSVGPWRFAGGTSGLLAALGVNPADAIFVPALGSGGDTGRCGRSDGASRRPSRQGERCPL
jgi:hypothetical protein